MRRNHRKGLVKEAGPQAHPTPVKQNPRPPPVPLTVLESAPHVGMVIIPATWAPGLGSPHNPAASLSVCGGGPFQLFEYLSQACVYAALWWFCKDGEKAFSNPSGASTLTTEGAAGVFQLGSRHGHACGGPTSPRWDTGGFLLAPSSSPLA